MLPPRQVPIVLALHISMGWFCFLHFHSTKTWIGRYSAFSPPLSMALAFVKSREKSISRPTDGSTLVYNVNTFLAPSGALVVIMG